MCDLNCKVSIITVVYNGVNTIEQTIKSVLGQTYKNIEYIIIDGKSTDGTQQIIEKYIDDISYYISEKDDGLYYAMNKGLKKATGEIIGIINSDDWYDINAVKNMVEFFCQKDAELVYGNTVVVGEDGVEKIGKIGSLETIWYSAPFRHPSVFVKKSVYDQLGVFNVNYKVAADYDLLLRFYSEDIRFEYLDKVIAYFRLGGLSTTSRRIGIGEDYKISMSYVDKSSNKDKTIPKIEEAYDSRCFYNKIENNGRGLYKLLKKYFNAEVGSLIIFGTGVWGKKCFRALSQTDIIVRSFSDNNSVMWGMDFQGIRVINPNELKDMKAYVLIAVMEHGDKIKKQLSNMENSGLKSVTLKELQKVNLINK